MKERLPRLGLLLAILTVGVTAAIVAADQEEPPPEFHFTRLARKTALREADSVSDPLIRWRNLKCVTDVRSSEDVVSFLHKVGVGQRTILAPTANSWGALIV
jgi:hypothetical protein